MVVPGLTRPQIEMATKLVKRDIEDNHTFTNRKRGFHNHFNHHMLASLTLGASAARLEHIYKRVHRPMELRNLGYVPGIQITPGNIDIYRHKDALYSDWLLYYLETIKANGGDWAKVLEEYFFHPSLFSGNMSGVFHPLIQVGYGAEFECEAIVAQGLAMGSVSKPTFGYLFNTNGDLLGDECEAAENGTAMGSDAGMKDMMSGSMESNAGMKDMMSGSMESNAGMKDMMGKSMESNAGMKDVMSESMESNAGMKDMMGKSMESDAGMKDMMGKSMNAMDVKTMSDKMNCCRLANNKAGTSLLSILNQVQHDKSFVPIVESFTGGDPFDDFVKKAGREVSIYASKWKISQDPDAISLKTKEFYLAACLLYASTPKKDFFLAHGVTSAYFLPILLPLFSIKNQIRLLRAHWAALLAFYIVVGTPEIKYPSQTTDSQSQEGETERWSKIFADSIDNDDEHLAKVTRGLWRGSTLFAYPLSPKEKALLSQWQNDDTQFEYPWPISPPDWTSVAEDTLKQVYNESSGNPAGTWEKYLNPKTMEIFEEQRKSDAAAAAAAAAAKK
ncbi:hypothetical protein H4219_000318 [Mycoemilia scoparia]|uniref:Uncharacterized protein n=1 Tax=Mycoemilia scoparia TaxID=417184 RepID=A0A9W8DWU5_9FUNG|nr:hypothetical protein H4219_000318 [Mycoemilia scoparia]